MWVGTLGKVTLFWNAIPGQQLVDSYPLSTPQTLWDYFSSEQGGAGSYTTASSFSVC